MNRSIALTCFLVAATAATAQDDVMVFGTIKNHVSGAPLASAWVVVASERGVRDTTFVDSSGTYELHLSYDRLWQLRYEAPGRVTKLIAIDTRQIPEAEKEGGHGMNIDMKLFLAEPGRDYSALKNPMSIARYVDSTGNIEWDLAMAERMRSVITAILDDSTAAPSVLAAPPPAPPVGPDPLKLVLGGAVVLVILVFAIRAVRSRSGERLS